MPNFIKIILTFAGGLFIGMAGLYLYLNREPKEVILADAYYLTADEASIANDKAICIHAYIQSHLDEEDTKPTNNEVTNYVVNCGTLIEGPAMVGDRVLP